MLTSLLVGTLQPICGNAGMIAASPELVNKEKKITYYTSGNFLYSLEGEEAIIQGYLGDGVTKIELDTLKIPAEVDGYQVTEIGDAAFYQNATHSADGKEYYDTLSYKKVIIPKGVKKIQDDVFFKSEMTQVELPEGLKVIGEFAFDDCKKLKKVDFPSSLRIIDCGAFMGCESITELDIPGSCEEIFDSAFSGCSKLKRVMFHEGTTNIYMQAFNSCYSLRYIEIPNSVVEVGDSAIEELYPLNGRKIKVVMRSMDTDMNQFSFPSFDMELWVYHGADALKYIDKEQKSIIIHYMKPSISEKKLTVKKGDAEILVLYGANKKVKWEVEDPKILKVTPYYGGKGRDVSIKGKKKGETIVTATYKGRTYRCKVKVK